MAWSGNIQEKKKKLKADFICFWSSASSLFEEQNLNTAVFINQDGRFHQLSSSRNYIFFPDHLSFSRAHPFPSRLAAPAIIFNKSGVLSVCPACSNSSPKRRHVQAHQAKPSVSELGPCLSPAPTSAFLLRCIILHGLS